MRWTPDPRKAVLEKYRKGLVQVYTGNGKGKTTAAFGQALRAIGQGYRVCVIQFMKGRKYGECLAAEKHLPNLTVHLCGLDSFVMRENPVAARHRTGPRRVSTSPGRRSPPAHTTWSSWTSSTSPSTSS